MLRGHVRGYTGYREHIRRPVRRREVPSGVVPLIISFGDPLDVALPGDREERRLVSFLAGLHDVPAVTGHGGRQRGVQVNLTPLGAFTLFGTPMRELANRAVGLPELLGGQADELVGRLAAAPDWAARFALLDDVFVRRLSAGPEPAPEVARAWELLARSGGRTPVRELAHEVAWSRRHLVVRFTEQVGLPPKSAGRVLRFGRSVGMVTRGVPLAEVATRCGFYDQAHFNRDFRAMAGCTPTRYRAGVPPDSVGPSADPGTHDRRG